MAYSDGRGRNALMSGYPQVALFAGENAATADKEALARAKQMHGSGIDQNQIWQETGWSNDPVGWSFEIPDDNFRETNTLMPGVGSRAVTMPYLKQYDHPELQRAYPNALGRARVTLDPSFAKREEADGMVTEGNRLWIDTDLPQPQRYSTGLHETQHMLDNTEGRRRFPGRDYMADPREQRAFNVEYRRTLTPEQRRTLSPLDTMPAALKAYLEKDN